jgi:hypothetical protein
MKWYNNPRYFPIVPSFYKHIGLRHYQGFYWLGFNIRYPDYVIKKIYYYLNIDKWSGLETGLYLPFITITFKIPSEWRATTESPYLENEDKIDVGEYLKSLI